MDKSAMGNSSSARMIWLVGSPIILTIGILGNVLTIIVLTRKQSRKTSTTVFLTGLAIADLAVMLNTLPRWWIIYLVGVDVRLLSNCVCKLHWFLGYCAPTTSSLIMSGVTIERTISTTKPFWVKTICTKRIAVAITISIVLFVMSLNVHIFYGFNLLPLSVKNQFYVNVTNNSPSNSDVQPFDEFKDGRFHDDIEVHNADNSTEPDMMCVWFSDASYKHFYINYYQIIAFTVSILVPQTVLIIGGIIIVRTLRLSKLLRRELTLYRVTQQHAQVPKRQFHQINKKSTQTTMNKSTQITMTLMLVNVVFFVCTTPVNIFMIGRSYWIDLDKGMTNDQEIIWAVVNMMFFLNYAINFVLYFLSGARFRKEVMGLFKCTKARGLHELSLSRMATVAVSDSYADASSENEDLNQNQLTAK